MNLRLDARSRNVDALPSGASTGSTESSTDVPKVGGVGGRLT